MKDRSTASARGGKSVYRKRARSDSTFTEPVQAVARVSSVLWADDTNGEWLMKPRATHRQAGSQPYTFHTHESV